MTRSMAHEKVYDAEVLRPLLGRGFLTHPDSIADDAGPLLLAEHSKILRNTFHCEQQLKNIKHISELLLTVLREGEDDIENFSGDLWLRHSSADEEFRVMVKACHGPIPPGLLQEISISKWISGLYACDHHGILEDGQEMSSYRPAFRAGYNFHFTGEWCIGGWRGYLGVQLGRNPGVWNAHKYNFSAENLRNNLRTFDAGIIEAISQTLWCALHLFLD